MPNIDVRGLLRLQEHVENIRHCLTDTLLQLPTMQVCRIFRSKILCELCRPLHLRRTSVGVPRGRRDGKLTRFFRRCAAMVAHRSLRSTKPMRMIKYSHNPFFFPCHSRL